MLSINNVTKVYKNGSEKIFALDNVTINFPEKGMIFITGKSGSGKSTLLNILGGLDKMTEGEVLINGFSTSSFKKSDFDAFRNAYIGFIFQEFHLIDDISVFDNIAISMKIQNKKQEINSIEDSLRLVDLENLGYRKPSELSGGQRQRIAVARAIIKNPRIILADEPTGNLDSVTGEKLIQTFKKIANDRLVIVVSHDKDLAYNYGDRVIELSDGKIITDLVRKSIDSKDSIQQLNEHLFHIKTATQINSLDFINGNLKKEIDNYICINTNEHNLGLAYPDNFDDFYRIGNQLNDFEGNNIEQTVIKKNSKMKLPKSYIAFKETIKMAFESFNRKKIRTALMVLFSLLSLSLFCITFKISALTTGDVAANTIQSNNIQIARIRKVLPNGTTDVLTSEDSAFLSANSFNPAYCYVDGTSIELMDFRTSYGFSSFKGIIEINNLDDLGFKLLRNSNRIDTINEIIITDYAAKTIIDQTFLGDNNDGNLQIMHIKSIEGLIGKRILLANNILYTVKDIIITDYLNLADEEFFSAKNFYLEHIFAYTGFTKEFMRYKTIYEDRNNFLITLIAMGHSISYLRNISSGFTTYNETSEEEFNFLYKKDDEPLKANEIYVSTTTLALWGVNIDYSNINELEYLVGGTSIFPKIVYKSKEVYVDFSKMEIKGVYEYTTFSSRPNFLFSPELADVFVESLYESPKFAYINPQKVKNLNTKVNKMMINNDLQLLIYVNDTYLNVADSLKENSQIFLLAGIGFSVLGFLFIILFMSNSLRLRKKEIGILRASGAKSKDIFQIFGVEILILSCIITIISTIAVTIFFIVINKNLSGLFTLSLVKLTIIDFVLLFGLSLVYLFISASIPILSIVFKKPIETIQKN